VRLTPLVVITLVFGIWFTVLTATAWTRGRRLAAALLGLLAAIDLAVALAAMQR
jgi:hypothetical protein